MPFDVPRISRSVSVNVVEVLGVAGYSSSIDVPATVPSVRHTDDAVMTPSASYVFAAKTPLPSAPGTIHEALSIVRLPIAGPAMRVVPAGVPSVAQTVV